MKKRGIVAALIALAGIAASARAEPDEAVRVLLDVSYAPDAGDFALKTTPLILEWYPRINELLYGADHPLPFKLVIVSFQHAQRYPGLTANNVIHISADTIKVMQDDYRGMVIHELTHVVQHYPSGQAESLWVIEGIADYVRHEAFEKDIKPTLRLNAQGHLYGYSDTEPFFHGLENAGADLTDKGYRRSYTVASSFLYWLEVRKDKRIVQDLNLALSQGRYTPELFGQFCGEPLDALWAEFVKESEKA
ncbi:MAG TPA: basic secretory protein-like protein [Alphaproteobacteria bacterium]|nr:basic secretory protein-like protein [Alphaproteobacteria bacterium]